MSNKTEENKVVQVDFGTTQPHITETTEKEMITQEQIDNMCLAVGRTTLEWAMFASRKEYIDHMLSLYDNFHSDDENPQGGLEVPKSQIILPQ